MPPRATHPSRPDFRRPPAAPLRLHVAYRPHAPSSAPPPCRPTTIVNSNKATTVRTRIRFHSFNSDLPCLPDSASQPKREEAWSELEERRVRVREASWARRRWRSGRNGTGKSRRARYRTWPCSSTRTAITPQAASASWSRSSKNSSKNLSSEGRGLTIDHQMDAGVERVDVDKANNKLTVVGTIKPSKLREFLETKTGKKVKIKFPKEEKKAEKKEEKEERPREEKKTDNDVNDPRKSSDDKKPKPIHQPPVSTLVLKIRLHCDGCIRPIKKNIYKIKDGGGRPHPTAEGRRGAHRLPLSDFTEMPAGVQEVTVDAAKDLVTVKGTMDAKTLPAVLKDKLKRGVEVVPPKKHAGGGGGGSLAGEKEMEEKWKKRDGEKEKGREEKAKEKKESWPTHVEVKLDVHCDGCALKIRRFVEKLEGVESVRVDAANNKLKAIGKINPWKLKEFLEAETKKKVELIFPKEPPREEKKEEKKEERPREEKKTDNDVNDPRKSSDDKKPKPIHQPPVSTLVLKIRLHCDGCIHRIKKNIYKIKDGGGRPHPTAEGRRGAHRLPFSDFTEMPAGVQEVTVDAAKDLVTVKGTMDAKTLPAVLRDKLKRGVEVVPPKKHAGGGGGGEEKKDKGGDGGGGEKKEEGGGVGEKKEKEGRGGAEKEAVATATTTTVAEANTMDYYRRYPAYGGYGYRVEMVHAPQIFSDENPNACSIM
ncbi:Heavy-metal-associated domain-containing protein [Musa troglodytarum]|uniref:Heavy-metal-associated domain-containing protein n=1 Tax=Musa troglodytarum TaxID=320322 RepID=A0A9E7HE53_9LILI|nr:Heavy-metal-associated domain-containing protein [Musa troglodytarum]